MKKRDMNKRFSLNKQTVANLSAAEQTVVRAGDGERCEETQCKSGSAYYFSSSAYIIGTVVIPATQMNTTFLPCQQITTTINPTL